MFMFFCCFQSDPGNDYCPLVMMRYESMDFEEKSRLFSLTPFRVWPQTLSLAAVWCMAVCLALFSCGWCAEEPASGPASALEDDVFSRISLAVKKVHTMSSAFEQERRAAMLKDPMISRGRFYFAKPDKIRWETIDPVPAGFSVNGQEARRWQGTSDPPEKITLSEAPFLQALIQQITAWTSADFASLKGRYDLKVIGEDPVTVGLVPLLAGERDYVAQVTLVFSPDLTYVTSVRIREKKGDEIVLRFSNAVINEPIADERF
jgi:outer membrane lipoprotein-sorting protein